MRRKKKQLLTLALLTLYSGYSEQLKTEKTKLETKTSTLAATCSIANAAVDSSG